MTHQDYWTVSTTPMTEHQAHEAAELLSEQFEGVEADALDPRAFLNFAVDRWGAECLRDGLVMVQQAGGEVGVLLEVVNDFLAYGYPYGPDDEGWRRPSL